ncbi:MAG: hypothetical protein ACFCVH_13160 [Alphaproteobacteria bacterium]
MRIAVATALAAGLAAAPVSAEPKGKLFGDVTGESAYFIGYWGMGAPEECIDSDTLAFYSSGAWAVTNGGGNPVEAIGTWSYDEGVLTVRFSDLTDPANDEQATGTVTAADEAKFTLSSDMLRGGSETLYRCS